jgi:hypothetical protein
VLTYHKNLREIFTIYFEIITASIFQFVCIPTYNQISPFYPHFIYFFQRICDKFVLKMSLCLSADLILLFLKQYLLWQSSLISRHKESPYIFNHILNFPPVSFLSRFYLLLADSSWGLFYKTFYGRNLRIFVLS